MLCSTHAQYTVGKRCHFCEVRAEREVVFFRKRERKEEERRKAGRKMENGKK